MKKTYQPKAEEVTRKWHIFDAKGKILGRFASDIVKYLTGKDKVKYAPHLDMGDYIIIINAKDIELTGNKRKQKVYQKHSGYPGGFKEIKFEKMISEQPEKVIELAVKRMLPDNRLRDKRMARLKVFADEKHPYEDKLRKN